MKKYLLALIFVLSSLLFGYCASDNASLFKGFMSTYNMFNSAISNSIAQNGKTESWDWSLYEDEIFDKYLKPYLQIEKTCRINQTDCWNSNTYRTLGERTPDIPIGLHKSYTLTNGTNIMFILKDKNCKDTGHTCAFIYADLNGFEDPNTTGRDYFKFYIHPKSDKILPVGYSYKGEPDIKSINKSCNVLSTGNYCGAKLLIENGMNY